MTYTLQLLHYIPKIKQIYISIKYFINKKIHFGIHITYNWIILLWKLDQNSESDMHI